MANNYYDATGVLVLDRVTPVITALFGAFKLDESYPGNGAAYIARTSEDGDPQWSHVLSGLLALAASLDVPVPDGAGNDDGEGDDAELSMPGLLDLLATHFGAEQSQDLTHIIERYAFDGDADLETLFQIATCFDDGHNLVAIRFEGCWHCSKPRLFEFGGNGCFISREVTLTGDSSQAPALGAELRKAIRGGDLEAAAARLVEEILSLLSGISDEPIRARLRTQVAERLLAGPSAPAAG